MNKPAIIVQALLNARGQTGALTLDEMTEAVRALAFLFDQDPDAAALALRGDGALALMLRAMCTVPKAIRRPQGRPKKLELNEREWSLLRALDLRAPGQTKEDVFREQAQINGETVEAVKRRYGRIGTIWK